MCAISVIPSLEESKSSSCRKGLRPPHRPRRRLGTARPQSSSRLWPSSPSLAMLSDRCIEAPGVQLCFPPPSLSRAAGTCETLCLLRRSHKSARTKLTRFPQLDPVGLSHRFPPADRRENPVRACAPGSARPVREGSQAHRVRSPGKGLLRRHERRDGRLS